MWFYYQFEMICEKKSNVSFDTLVQIKKVVIYKINHLQKTEITL